MSRPPLIILVGNYRPDGQQSMSRFAAMLERELRQRNHDVIRIAPRIVFGRIRAGARGAGKWLGYIDKLLLFPWTLRRVVRSARRTGRDVIVHICDHSNAVYTRHLRSVPHLITCNDLLAVRSARGEFPANRTRWSGRILQRMIVSGLKRAQQIVCISDATRQDVIRLCSTRRTVELAYMGLHHPYAPPDPFDARARVDRLLATVLQGDLKRLSTRRFILHVGGNQWYKNRLGVLKIYKSMRGQSAQDEMPRLVMVGRSFTPGMRTFVREHDLERDVIDLRDVANSDLEALYSQAQLLLYPSLAEGFGWPILEAFACGCPVVTSGRAPMTEVGGDAAVYVDPDDIDAAARQVLSSLREPPSVRRARIERGFIQRARFSTSGMIDAYAHLYRRLASERGNQQSSPIAAA